MAFRYQPPSIQAPIPYPHVLDPQTGKPLTAPTIAALHHGLWMQLLHTSRLYLAREASLDLPDWVAISESLNRLASLCLFDALEVEEANPAHGSGR